MTRVIHTGDTHLGYRQYHRSERKEDFVDAFRQVAEDAAEDRVDAVVHAGDLFHDRRPGLSEIMGALSVLRSLDEAGVPFLAIVGNHEAKRRGQWLDLFESLGLATRLDGDPVEIGDTAFYGLDFVPRSRRDDLDLSFETHDAEHAALVTHGLFKPFDLGEWDVRELLDETDVEFDAVLLGDNHDPGTRQVEGAWVTYCGSTERASAAEREDRGYNLVTFDDEVDVRRRGLDTREFRYIDVELGEGEGIERVRERIEQYDLTDAVAVVTIDGEGNPVTPATVEEYGQEQGALVTRVTDHREVPEETEREVSFADPDDAVRERVRELGLSAAARGIDETVRASKTADSNVADEVESQVRDLVEAGDAEAFASVGSGESDGSSDETADGEALGATSEATDVSVGPSDGTAEATEESAGTPGVTGGESTADSTAATDGEGGVEDGAGTRAPAEQPTDDGEDQASMGEYL